MKRYNFIREEDETGVSGTGHVAEVVEFSDGTAVMNWNTETSSTGVYDSIDDLIELHGHEGKAYLEPVDDEGPKITDLPNGDADMSGKL